MQSCGRDLQLTMLDRIFEQSNRVSEKALYFVRGPASAARNALIVAFGLELSSLSLYTFMPACVPCVPRSQTLTFLAPAGHPENVFGRG